MGTASNKDLKNLVRDHSTHISDPAGRRVRILSENPALQISETAACSMGAVFRVAIDQGIWPHRYVRNRDIIALDEQARLADSKVAVIGCGGLGGTVLLLLARIGIGQLVVVDGDVFDETNLNRQAVAAVDNIGRSKSAEAADLVRRINPAVAATAVGEKIGPTNADRLLEGVQVVVDALDNIPDRLALESAARGLAVPLVHGALAGFDGQVMTIFPEDPGLRQLYGEAPYRKEDPARPEAVLGVPAPTPSLVATLQSMEVIKILLGRGQLIRNRMLYIDLESGRFESFRF
jgi:molybdopterin/thiamine biosynthesis adenylyltransferase